ncbi:Putative fungal transcription factor [Septoria linicola]|uniref:Fungal transcription factor n=1 Tax=Septoria linicola TaxID=215465 RepID=A0A9Q9AXU1_9PEZI|nr:Putative fungal transcription factor [Septoria linicola]
MSQRSGKGKDKVTELSFITYDGQPNPKDQRPHLRCNSTPIESKDEDIVVGTVLEELSRKDKDQGASAHAEDPLEEEDEAGELATGLLERSAGDPHAALRSIRRVRRRRNDSPASSTSQSSAHLIRSSKLASDMARQRAAGDPNDDMASILGRLNLDFSTVMAGNTLQAHYKWIAFAQSPDFERIFMPEHKRGYGYETLISRIARDPALVSAAVLIATGHILSVRNSGMSGNIARCIFESKNFVLNTVNEALRDPTRATTDPLVCAILILASHEGLQGKHENYHIHMTGLVQMINMRGGLSVLNETQKSLEAFIIWQDTNVAAVAGCEPYYKQTVNRTEGLPVVKANPLMWLLKDV